MWVLECTHLHQSVHGILNLLVGVLVSKYIEAPESSAGKHRPGRTFLDTKFSVVDLTSREGGPARTAGSPRPAPRPALSTVPANFPRQGAAAAMVPAPASKAAAVASASLARSAAAGPAPHRAKEYIADDVAPPGKPPSWCSLCSYFPGHKHKKSCPFASHPRFLSSPSRVTGAAPPAPPMGKTSGVVSRESLPEVSFVVRHTLMMPPLPS